MNRIYRLVWNRGLRVWQVASEFASQSRGGQSPAGGVVSARAPRYAARVALTLGLSALSTAVHALCMDAGTSVTCTGVADAASPSFASSMSDLSVAVTAGATLGVSLDGGGAAVSLTGSDVTLTNSGWINSNLLGSHNAPASGLVIGNAAASALTVHNMSTGRIVGTAAGSSPILGLDGMAMAVRNGSGGVSLLRNAGTISNDPILGVSAHGPDLPVAAAYGGGRVAFDNERGGTIIGRVAFEAPATSEAGNSFTNAGTIQGSVSLGQGGANTFTAMTGSAVTAGNGSDTAELAVVGMSGLRFAPAGKIDGGAGVNSTLVLQDADGSDLIDTGSASGDTYVNFHKLQVDSGTWTLSGAPLANGGTIGLNGGLAKLMNDGVLGMGYITAQGGSISAEVEGLTVANNIELDTGGLTTTGASSFTLSGILSGAGRLNVASGGTLTLSGVNRYAGGTTVAIGSTLQGDTSSLQNNIVNNGTLSFVQNTDGTYAGSISGMGGLTKSGTGAVTLAGPNSFEGGLTVDAGTLALGPAGSLLADSVITVNAGGTFDLSASSSHSLQTLNGNGGRVNLGAASLNLQTGSYAGVIAGTGSVQKQGPGTLALNGANSYTGTTGVWGGTLLVGADATHTAARVNGDITVANTATLGGFGQVNGNVYVMAGGRLAPGAPEGAFTVNGDLTLASASQADFSLGASGASHSVTVNGNLHLNGAQLNILAGGFGPGVYRLFDYAGTLDQSGGGLGAPLDMVLEFDLSTRQINLLNATGAELNFWNANGVADGPQRGGGSGVWSQTGTGWTNATGSLKGPRAPADAFAIFGGAPGTVRVDTTPGAVAAQGIQFASDGYTLEGDALALSGTSSEPLGEVRVGDGSAASAAWTATIDNVLTGKGIDKTGAGTLVLNGANAYTQATRLSLGTLSVSSDANLGAPTAGLDFQGGTLRVTGTGLQSTSRAITFGAAGGGLDIADAGNTYTVAQALSGNGALAKLGAGTLVLTGDNTYLGGTSVQAGTLQVGDGAVSGSIAGNADIAAGATLVFKRSDRDVFSGDTSGAGELRQAGAGTLVLTGRNTYTGNTTIESGTLQVGDGGAAGSLAGSIVNHGSLVFNRSDDSAYAGALSGAGAMAKLGAGTLAMTGDSSAYTGAVQLSAGALQVDGKLGGQLQAAAGTTLAGTGTLNTVSVGSGATLSPGNAASPLGRMNLLGDLTFQPGSTYRVASTAGGQNSSVHVAGTAKLAGSVVQMAQNGTYAPSTTYAILIAGNGVQGRFDAVSSNLAFLAPSLSYGDNRVDLVVDLKDVPDGGGTRPIQFADAAVTGNQRAVARALQSLSTHSALYRHVLNLPDGAPPAAFNALSGESHASAISVLQGQASTFTRAPMTRLRANLNAGWMPGVPTAQLGLGDAAALPQAAAQPLWTQVSGNWTTLGGDGNTARTTQSDAGITIGGDQAVGGGWRLGGALGYTDSRSRTSDRASSAEADSYSITIYGGKAFEAGAGKINLSLGAAYTWSDLETQRSPAAAGLDQTLKADYGASTGQVFTELGYAMPLNDRITLEPFVGANYSDLRTRGFTESGGDAALRGESGRNSLTTTTLGLHALSTFESAGARGHVHGTLGWRHAFGDLDPASTLSFVQGSDSFTAAGVPIARDAAVVELGVGMEVSKRTTVGLVYGGQFGAGNRQNSGTLDVRYRF